ncbi:MAG: hypothetical protein GXX91_17860 [Verrucomicrobiaceae bacterium]|nr:hypothetical protein [Verrucomicrobiaceae bacterium]
MNPDLSRTDLLPSLGPALSGTGLLVCALLWLVTVKQRNGHPSAAPVLRALGFLLAAGGCWFAFQLLGAFFALATSWPLPLIAILGALAAEAILWIYAFEKSLVPLKRGRLLLALRLGALALLLLILLQPVRSFVEEREIVREIAILMDDSDSMGLADSRLSPSQKLDRAALFGVAGLEKRPALHRIDQEANALDAALASELEALRSVPHPRAALESRAARLPDFFTSLENHRDTLVATLTQAQEGPLPEEVRDALDDYQKRSRDGLGRILPLAEKAAAAGQAEELIKQLEVARSELRGILETIAASARKADAAFYEGLGESIREAIENAAATPRREIARQVLQTPLALPDDVIQEGRVTDSTLLDQLRERYHPRYYHYARDVTQITDPLATEATEPGVAIGERAERARTDLTGALEHVLDTIPPESLAGVLLLSDGRHNSTTLPEDSLRQLALRNAPLSAVPIGGDRGPDDISLLSLEAPESIYLGDRIVVTATAKLDGFLGEKVEAELLANDAVIDTVTIEVADVSFRTEVKFVHSPESKGIQNYRVRLQPDPREIFQENNAWDFKVAVTDDRTNVLLVDGFPRWEFRYLRNLFYGRDKSVHLQYVLLTPDEIHRARKGPTVAASASRPFGEAEATTLPANLEEWQRFDVIILGDIEPAALSERDWSAIREAVTRRGAMLVCIAGPRHMPHGHGGEILRELLPVRHTPATMTKFDTPEAAFQIQLTSVGRDHPVTSQSSSRALNEEIWSGFPPMRWRYSGATLKETAEVLAYAQPVGASGAGAAFPRNGSPASVEAAIEQLANQKTIEAERAVISTIRAGLGKVLLLHFDQTWRFRYGVGDTYHHRFWGQVTRWGAGPNLRAGNDLVRLGTDRLSYTPDDPIEVTAKVLDPDRRPVTKAGIEVEIWKDGARIRKQKLTYRAGSSGLYETSLTGLRDEGEYQIQLAGDEVTEALAAVADGPKKIATELLVVATRNPVELAELTADRDFLHRATAATGGRLAELNDLDSLLDSFGAPKEVLKERRNITLWDKWPFLIAFLGLLTTEWILRRRSGLV